MIKQWEEANKDKTMHTMLKRGKQMWISWFWVLHMWFSFLLPKCIN